MARRGKGRKYRRYLKGRISQNDAMGTLGARAVKAVAVADVLTEKAWLSSVKALYSLMGFTTGSDDGPIMVGIAHQDYTAAEIEEWVENLSNWDQGDLIA